MSGLSGVEIYEGMNAGFVGGLSGVMSMGAAQGSTEQAVSAHQEIDMTLRKFEDKMSEAWQGEASGSARESLQKIFAKTAKATDGMTRADSSLRGQGDNFERTRDSLVEMERGRDEYSAHVEDATFGLVDAETAKAMWDEKNRHNIQQYAKYKDATDRNSEYLMKDFQADESEDSSGGGDQGSSGDSGSDSTGKEWVPGPGNGPGYGRSGGPGAGGGGVAGGGPAGGGGAGSSGGGLWE